MSEASYHHGNLYEELLDRAVAVIGEKGVEGLSLRGLARDLGVSHAAPARHFAAKSDLLAAIVRTAYERMTATTIEAAKAAGEDPIKRLNAMAKASISWAANNRSYHTALMNPDVSRFADDELKAALGIYIKMILEACIEAQKAGLYTNRPLRAVLLYGIATTIGASIIFSDSLLNDILGPFEGEGLIDEIVNQVIPVDIRE